MSGGVAPTMASFRPPVKLRTFITSLLLGSALCVAACSDSQAGYNESKYSYEQRDAYRTEMEQTLAKLEARMAQLRAKAASGGESLKAGTNTLIDETGEGMTRLRQELSGLGSVTKEGWTDFKHGFGKTMDDLNRKLDSALH